MRALRYDGPGQIIPVGVAEPVAGPDDVLVRPLQVGICFTDKLAYDSPEFQVYPIGTVLGHEFCGRVAEVGGNVDGVRVGDLVAPDPRVYCGACTNCHAGYMNHCTTTKGWIGVHGGWPGALAELVRVPALSLYRMPDGLSHSGGAAVEAFTFALRQIRHVQPAVGDNVVVLGAEDYGLAETGLLAGVAGEVLVADPNELRRAAALRFGATVVVDPGFSLVEEYRAGHPHGADLVVVNAEAYVARSQHYLREAIELCRPGATILLSRSSGSSLFPSIDPALAAAKQLDIRYFGTCFGEEPWRGGRDRGDWAVTLSAMTTGRLSAERLGATVIGFDELRAKRDVDELMHLLPDHATKVFVEVST
jgi:(R,R)-butanediol dehydrogenase/meso-butanediol dehydrogenase/diacetyl reductase